MKSTHSDAYQALFLLCDKDWNIVRIFKESQNGWVKTGTSFEDYLENPEKLASAENREGSDWTALSLKLTCFEQEMSAFIRYLQEHYLVFLGYIANQKDFKIFSRDCAEYFFWADKNLRIPYDDGYYQIQLMNNQLINSQRALLKTNKKLESVLQEIREANSLISLLERDELTDLYTAASFYKKAGERIRKEPERSFDIILLDVDRFKLVNELFGRDAGDTLLKSIAILLIGMEHAEEGILARFVADTFFVLMPSEYHFYEALQKKTAAHLREYPLPLQLHEKLGVYPVTERELSVEKMCDRARLAMGMLQIRLDQHIAIYDQAFHESLIREQKILDSVHNALKNQEFEMYLQPKVKLPGGELMGAEALIRWRHPEMGWISPGIFIPILERNGYIYKVDQYIWESACRFQAMRRERGLRLFPISVNVARMDLYQDDLTDVLIRMLERYRLDPKLIHLEVIERNYVEDSEKMFAVLTGLREAGFLIEMDDFGTGESSLAMAARLPVDYLKLDRQFVLEDVHDKRHREVIRFIMNMAKALNMEVISEGIETKEQAELMYDMGCDFAQGFYYSRPKPYMELLDAE